MSRPSELLVGLGRWLAKSNGHIRCTSSDILCYGAKQIVDITIIIIDISKATSVKSPGLVCQHDSTAYIYRYLLAERTSLQIRRNLINK